MTVQIAVGGVRDLYENGRSVCVALCVAVLAIALGAAALLPRSQSTPLSARCPLAAAAARIHRDDVARPERLKAARKLSGFRLGMNR
jgi:hypothetical protein